MLLGVERREPSGLEKIIQGLIVVHVVFLLDVTFDDPRGDR